MGSQRGRLFSRYRIAKHGAFVSPSKIKVRRNQVEKLTRRAWMLPNSQLRQSWEAEQQHNRQPATLGCEAKASRRADGVASLGRFLWLRVAGVEGFSDVDNGDAMSLNGRFDHLRISEKCSENGGLVYLGERTTSKTS